MQTSEGQKCESGEEREPDGELRLVLECQCGHLKYRLEDLWGRTGSRGKGLRFTDTGALRAAAIFGWITGIFQAGKRDLAEAAAADIVGKFDMLSGYGGTVALPISPDRPERTEEVPCFMVELYDDGTHNGFGVFWHGRCEDQENAHPEAKEWEATIWRSKEKYVRWINGGLLYHGPGAGEVFAVTLTPSLWSIHT